MSRFGEGHVVVEGDAALLERLLPAVPGHVRAVVTDDASASAALLLALDGGLLLVHAPQGSATVDVLCDDLRRLARVDVVRAGDEVPAPRTSAEGDLVDDDGAAILRLLADGLTLGQAATRLGLSRRTADRRLAAAREALGARSTAEAVAVWSSSRPAGS